MNEAMSHVYHTIHVNQIGRIACENPQQCQEIASRMEAIMPTAIFVGVALGVVLAIYGRYKMEGTPE